MVIYDSLLIKAGLNKRVVHDIFTYYLILYFLFYDIDILYFWTYEQIVHILHVIGLVAEKNFAMVCLD
jgi:hypothetical protein